MTAKETLDLTVSIPLQELAMKECVESIPISVYTAAVVSDIATFHSCLIHLSILPDRWTCGLVNGLLTGLATILFFTKLSTIASTLPSPQILFSIHVLRYYTSQCTCRHYLQWWDFFFIQLLEYFTWCLKVSESPIDLTCRSLFKSLPP